MVAGSRFSQEYFGIDVNITINPFQQLYFSDDTQTENNFVELFSSEVLQTAIILVPEHVHRRGRRAVVATFHKLFQLQRDCPTLVSLTFWP